MAQVGAQSSNWTRDEMSDVNRMSRVFREVVVIGGGPAGAIAAMLLAKQGRDVAIVDSSDCEFKIGETLPPSAKPLLKRLQLIEIVENGGHIPCYGNQSAWGSRDLLDTDFIFDPNGHGWHLDRALFDEQLRQQATLHGAAIYRQSRVAGVSRSNGIWNLQLTGARHSNTQCNWVLDASGRSRWLARKLKVKLIQHDSLIAAASVFETRNDVDSRTLVESVPDGWWYTALLPESKRITVFFTDANTHTARQVCNHVFLTELLGKTTHIRTRVKREQSLVHGPVVRAAESARLESVAGHNWLALGDAAMSFDPLSSQGILTAMHSAESAANALQNHEDHDAESLARYSMQLREEYEQYLRDLHRYYAMETRWMNSPFWNARVVSGSENK